MRDFTRRFRQEAIDPETKRREEIDAMVAYVRENGSFTPGGIK